MHVYLHYVYDLWVHRWRRTKVTGDVVVVRYADDTIVGFERGKLRDAELLEKARAFKEDFVKNQKPDKAKTAQIIEAWKRWKA